MTADQVERILVDLLMQLPAELRPFVGGFIGGAAATITVWTPLAVVAWVCVLFVAVAAVCDQVAPA